MTKTILVDIQRYRPEMDSEPFIQSFEVPYTQEMSILDALHYIKDNLDSTVSFRWSCQMAICGSCGYMVNNVPKLGCKTFLRDYFPEKVTIAALANFPIERDLVADISDFIQKLEDIKPYIIRENQGELVDGEYIQTPEQMQRYKQFSLCINCGLCYSACPQYGLNNKFLGPAALALMQRYNQDNRDQGLKERLPLLNSEDGVWGCTFVGYCSDVCPKGVDPAAAVNQSKGLSATDYVISKIGMHKKSTKGESNECSCK